MLIKNIKMTILKFEKIDLGFKTFNKSTTEQPTRVRFYWFGNPMCWQSSRWKFKTRSHWVPYGRPWWNSKSIFIYLEYFIKFYFKNLTLLKTQSFPNEIMHSSMKNTTRRSPYFLVYIHHYNPLVIRGIFF
jgi:hypothetical protein